MTTTAAGDAAVARLNKATEAFEKIITGASNQVVDVPGYGNQPTLAARVDERLDETTATAAAEANRSRDEANRSHDEADRSRDEANRSCDEANRSRTEAESSKLSADRAAQITGLETVADAIGLAALPLPDVWAPLSDSLRLITGYGRDVLVGSDVVASMVNFSRSTTATYIGKDGQLKTAAANEPRFEKEGLLIEGQSANLFQNSNPHIGVTTADGYTKEALTGSGLFSDCAKLIKKAASAYTTLAPVTSGGSGAYSVSAFYNYAKSTIRNISVLVRNSSASQNIINAVINLDTLKSNSPAFTVEIVDSEWIRVVGTITLTSANQLLMFYPVATGGSSSDGAIGDFIIYQGLQLEALPFASSYIPTTGAAVTRAADVCWIDKNNLPTGGFSVAVNFESRCVSVNPADSNCSKIALLSTSVSNSSIKLACGKDTANGITTGAYGWAKNTAGAITYFTGSPSVQIPRYQGCMKLAVSSIRCRFGVNDEFVSAAGLPRGFDPTDILLGAYRIAGSAYGVQHIRNLRIWHLDLTDDQLKAVA